MSWEWLTTQLGRVWQPFALGSLLAAGASAIVGYFGMRALWRWHVVRDWEKRRKRRAVSDAGHKK